MTCSEEGSGGAQGVHHLKRGMEPGHTVATSEGEHSLTHSLQLAVLCDLWWTGRNNYASVGAISMLRFKVSLQIHKNDEVAKAITSDSFSHKACYFISSTLKAS